MIIISSNDNIWPLFNIATFSHKSTFTPQKIPNFFSNLFDFFTPLLIHEKASKKIKTSMNFAGGSHVPWRMNSIVSIESVICPLEGQSGRISSKEQIYCSQEDKLFLVWLHCEFSSDFSILHLKNIFLAATINHSFCPKSRSNADRFIQGINHK